MFFTHLSFVILGHAIFVQSESVLQDFERIWVPVRWCVDHAYEEEASNELSKHKTYDASESNLTCWEK